MKLSRILAVILKETREILRDRVTLATSFIFPLVMLFGFGYAVSLEVEDVRFGVLDQDQTPASAALIDAFAKTNYFELVRAYNSEQDIQQSMQSNEVKLVVVIPPNFYTSLAREGAPPVQLLVDGTYSSTALIALNYGMSIVSSFRQEATSQINIKTRVWYNPSLQSMIYIVSGLYAVIIASFPPLLTTLAIVREKESGSIQQIYASPLTVSEFMIGKLLPYGVISAIQIASIILTGYYWFGVPFQGSMSFMAAASLVYVFCNVGIGLLISTITNSQLLAVLLALVVTMMPATLFSGFIFPVFAMAEPVQLYTYLYPARYFIELSRGIVLKDAGPIELIEPLLLLILYTSIVLISSVLLFKKKVA